jgi:hypothetical protein
MGIPSAVAAIMETALHRRVRRVSVDEFRILVAKVNEIATMQARMEERQIAQVDATELHRHNLEVKLDTLATKQLVENVAQRVDAVEERTDKLEKNQGKAAWAIIAAWVAGIAVAAKTFKGV